jgi:hypothetical protein
MDLPEIKEKLKPGDIDTAGKMCGLSAANAYKSLEREGSKNHTNMLRALEMIVHNREKLIAAAQAHFKQVI